MKSRIIIAAVSVLVLGVLTWTGYHRAVSGHEGLAPAVIRPAVVRCAPLEQRQYQMIESFYGLLEARATVDVSFQISGRISQLGPSPDKKLEANDLVNPGDVLALLEPLRYEAAVEQAKAGMKEAQAAMSSAQAIIADATARLQDAQNELNRLTRLRKENVANAREEEKAQLAVSIAQAAVDTAKAQYASAQAAYDSSKAASTMATVNLNDATLKAPICGLVSMVPVEMGQTVSPGQKIATIVDTTTVKLVLGVVERKLPLLKRGQDVAVNIQALQAQSNILAQARELSQPRQGKVTIVSPAADPVTGLFRVEIELDNADGMLRPGMIGKANVTVMERHVVAIPADAAQRIGDQATAYFVANHYKAGLDLGGLGRAELDVHAPVARKVEFTPLAFDKDYYLVADLPAGLSRLVVEGQSRLVDGQPVMILDDPETAQASATSSGSQAGR